MNKIKEGLFWFIMFYVIIVSFLFIKQSFVVYKTMYKEININQNENYEKFIKESRAKLSNYRTLATTQEELNCLNEVEKGINISYKNQNLGTKTYKELKEYYYNKTDDEVFYNYINIQKLCNLTDRNDTLKQETTKYAVSNAALIEPELIDSTFIYEIDFCFEDWLRLYFTPSTESLLINSEQTTRDRVIINEKNYISSILEMVVEKYEK